MNRFRLIELGLLGLFILLIVLQISDYSVSTFLLVDLALIDLFWLLSMILTKKQNLNGFDKKSIIEKILISILLWGIALNVSTIPFSTLLISLGLLILSIYYIINGIKNLISKKMDWLSSIERLLCGIILFGFLLRFRHYPGAGILRGLSLSLLSLLMLSYSIVAIVKMIKSNQIAFGVILLLFYWGISASINYILYDSMFWAGSDIMFFSGFVFTAIVALVLLIKWIISDRNGLVDTQKLLIFESFRRAIIYGSICLFFYFITPYQYFRLDFGNRPKLINAYIKCHFDSNNEDTDRNCAEFQELDQKFRSGQYHEGDEE